jgi:hypothetical protein
MKGTRELIRDGVRVAMHLGRRCYLIVFSIP